MCREVTIIWPVCMRMLALVISMQAIQPHGSLPLSFESVLCNFSQADYWFGAQENTLLKCWRVSRVAPSLFPIGQGVFRIITAAVRPMAAVISGRLAFSPDLLLADVIKGFASELLPHYQFYYMRQLGR